MNKFKTKFLSLPRHFFIAIALTVFVYEVIIMLVLGRFGAEIPTFIVPFIDAFLLLVFLLPVLNLLFYRPMKLSLERYILAEKEIKKINEELENIIEERTIQLNHLAYHDTLTDLPNRRLLNLKLEKVIKDTKASGTIAAIMFADLDNLKQINDSYGHTFGDELIISFANRLKKLIRPEDTLARWGGDEFALIIPGFKSVQVLDQFAQRLMSAFQEPFKIKGEAFYVTPSIGIATYPADGLDIENIIKNADTAMYKAKELGGNNYQFYTSALNEKTLEKMQLTNELRQALVNDEFVIHYQPIFDSCTRQIIGAEALLRWNSSKYGLVRPNDFIPIAEETGIIVPIGEWVIDTATKQFKQWQGFGSDSIYLAVNLSSKQFMEPNLAASIFEILQRNNFDPKLLRLEITEGVMVNDLEFTAETLQKLSSRGVRISIDDFGTGYSSLTYLKRFPIDTIKIDRSFISEMTTNNGDKEIVMATIALAKGLKLGTIAEGVETQEQLNVLQQKDCALVQGFLFSPPLTTDEFGELMKKEMSKTS